MMVSKKIFPLKHMASNGYLLVFHVRFREGFLYVKSLTSCHSLGGISMAPILAKTCAAAFPTSTCGKTKAVVVASFTKLRELAGKATSTSSQSHE